MTERKVIHAQFAPDFQPDPSDPEAVGRIAAEALRREETDRALLTDISEQLTCMQREHGYQLAHIRSELSYLRSDVNMLVGHCKSRTAACNQLSAISAPPAGGRSRKMDWKNTLVKLGIVIVALAAFLAAGYVDPALKDIVKGIAFALVGWVIPAPSFGGGTPPKPPLPPVVGAILLIVGFGLLQGGCTASFPSSFTTHSSLFPLIRREARTDAHHSDTFTTHSSLFPLIPWGRLG